jgi:hypothetical protein
MRISKENEHRLTILFFVVIFTAMTHLIFDLGDFLPPPGPNVYPVAIAWIFSGLGAIWSTVHYPQRCKESDNGGEEME